MTPVFREIPMKERFSLLSIYSPPLIRGTTLVMNAVMFLITLSLSWLKKSNQHIKRSLGSNLSIICCATSSAFPITALSTALSTFDGSIVPSRALQYVERADFASLCLRASFFRTQRILFVDENHDCSWHHRSVPTTTVPMVRLLHPLMGLLNYPRRSNRD